MEDTNTKMTTPLGFPFILVTRVQSDGRQQHWLKLDKDRAEEMCDLTGFEQGRFYNVNKKTYKWDMPNRTEGDSRLDLIYSELNNTSCYSLFRDVPNAIAKRSSTLLNRLTGSYDTSSVEEVKHASLAINCEIERIDRGLPSLIKALSLIKIADGIRAELSIQAARNQENALEYILNNCGGDCSLSKSSEEVVIECDSFTAKLTFK